MTNGAEYIIMTSQNLRSEILELFAAFVTRPFFGRVFVFGGKNGTEKSAFGNDEIIGRFLHSPCAQRNASAAL